MHALLLLLLAAAPTTERSPLKLGDLTVVRVRHTAGTGPLLVNVHDDENTSVQAALQVIEKRGGTVLELQHTGERLLRFHLEGKAFTADPNRIFTAQGVPATLRKNGGTSKAAETAVQAFAAALLADLRAPEGSPLIALHNNTLALSYSVQSYRPGGADAGEAAEVFEAKGRDPNDFFLVTERAHFEALKAKGFNVVLQKPAPDTDDGSLSVYCAQHGLAYVNVEAQHGHASEQAAMLEALYDVLALH